MEKKMTFNDDAENYDKYRPDYPVELFNDIIQYSENSIHHVLEIGAGTGQATQWFAAQGMHTIAIDIGRNMIDCLSDKFKDYPNVKGICTSFEDYAADSCKFDLVCSATAFHWLDYNYALPKIKNVLKTNGIIALFWNHPFVGRTEDVVHNKIRMIYEKYRPNDKTPQEFSVEDTDKYKNILNDFGFEDVKMKLYCRKRHFTADEYICLLNTYSDHRILPVKIKEEFENEIRNAIRYNGNEIIVYDTIDLYVGRKI